MSRAGALTAKIVPRIADIAADQWDACALAETAKLNPFVAHAFLKALEDAGCVARGTGWTPSHIVIEDTASRVTACMPTYVKSHSQGEYVFDHAWADAYNHAGGHYYPKLQCAVPFTPVPGPRLLVRPGEDADARTDILVAAAKAAAQQLGVSSLHVTFLDEAAWQRLGEDGFLKRTDQQFHWLNRGYATFDEFLGDLASRKRKTIRKEREQALSAGISIELLRGAAITEAHWDAFFAFYMDTGSRKWGRPYLNRRFFSLLGQGMADHCLLIMAKRHGRYVAGALNLIGGDALYGRYWGAVEHHPCLHFEVCYYQAIDYAISHGLARVEAGAQGEHKLARGYLPSTTYSAHYIRDPGLRRAIDRYLDEERRHVARVGEVLTEAGPFRKGPLVEEQD